jgi:hypothetical protein
VTYTNVAPLALFFTLAIRQQTTGKETSGLISSPRCRPLHEQASKKRRRMNAGGREEGKCERSTEAALLWRFVAEGAVPVKELASGDFLPKREEETR